MGVEFEIYVGIQHCIMFECLMSRVTRISTWRKTVASDFRETSKTQSKISCVITQLFS